MSNKFLVGISVVFVLVIVMILIFAGASSSGGVPTQEEYEKMLSGITAEYGDDESVFVDLSKLTDDVQFNNEIQAQDYTKLTIKTKENFNSLGVVFMVKPSDVCTIKFTLYKNEQILASSTTNFLSTAQQDVNLLFNDSIEIKTTDSFYVLVENENKTPFVFDTLLSYFDNFEE